MSNVCFFSVSEGVPEAPVIELQGDILQWARPDDNGSPIIQYRIIAMYVYGRSGGGGGGRQCLAGK